MKINSQGYALPLALIVVAIFSIFVANISLDSDSSIQNHIIEKYEKLSQSLDYSSSPLKYTHRYKEIDPITNLSTEKQQVFPLIHDPISGTWQ